MGCSSSALNKAGDSSRFGSGVPSNENSSSAEQNKFCVAQPKPCTPGGEAAFHGKAQRQSHPSLERPKASVVPTANGVQSYHQPSPANDETPGKQATDHSRPTQKIEPLVPGGECALRQPGDRDSTLGTKEVKEDTEARAEVQSLKGNAETEPLRTPSERDSPGAEGDTELPQAGTMTLLQTAKNILPLETAQELPPEEATGNDTQPQTLEATPTENSAPEIPEGSQPTEISEKQPPSEARGAAEQPQALGIVLRENETPQLPDRSQPVPTPGMDKPPCVATDGLRNAHESQPQVTGGSRVHSAGTGEAAAKVEMARETHPDKEEPHIEGETGEKVEAEMKNEEESEEAEAKEKETGEAVDLGAAGAADRRA